MSNIFARKADLVRFIIQDAWKTRLQTNIPFTYISHGQHVQCRLSFVKLLTTKHRVGYTENEHVKKGRLPTTRNPKYCVDMFVYNWAGGHRDYNYLEVNARFESRKFKILCTFDASKSVGVEVLAYDQFLGKEDAHVKINGRIANRTKRMYIGSLFYSIVRSIRSDQPLDDVLDYLEKYLMNKIHV